MVSIDAAVDPASTRFDRSPDTGPDGTGTGTGPWRRRLAGWPAQAAASTALLALLSHLRYGYLAGDRDHVVLAPIGMRWADPTAFAGDWMLDNAPQPHWLFDAVTWAGASTGTLGAVYLLYWLAGMAAFGVATTLLARTWVPRMSWPAVGAVTVLAAVGPLYVLGSGVHLYATALPNGLGGCLLYLCAAALLVDRHRLAAVAGTATALAHVQHGVVALVLLAMTVLAVRVLRTRLDRWLLGGVLGTVAVVTVNLSLRPVAGELSDFQEVCGQLIPYHCEATWWSWREFYGGLGFVALAPLTIAFVGRRERFRWVVVVLLPAVALVAGVFADRLNVPVLGLAAQGLNVYRLSVELFQFSLFGLLVAAFAPLTARRRWLALAAALLLGWYGTQGEFWGLDGNETWMGERNEVTSLPLLFVAALCLVAVVAVRTVPGLVPHRATERFTRGAIATGLVALLVAGVAGNIFGLPRFDPRFFPHPALTAWGEQVRAVVPPGAQLLVPPSNTRVRIATRRGVVVDCKLVPYGGAAWREYRSRMEAVGGFDQCGSAGWRDVDANRLAELARRYGAAFVVVRSDVSTDATLATALTTAGWTQVAGERPGAPYRVLEAPWEAR